MRRRRCDHMHKFCLVGRRHHHKARQAGQKRHIEGSGMGRPVGPDQPRPIDGKAHREALDCHVMHNLIVAPLQKGRIDRAKGLHPARSQTGTERHRMLLGDPHIETPFRKPVMEQVQPRPVRHRRRDRNNPCIPLRLGDQALCKDLGIGRRVRRRLGLHPGQHIELRGRMAPVLRRLCRGIALALARQHMDQHRPRRPRLHRAQDGQQLIKVMSVNRADIGESQFLEQRAPDGHALQHLLRPPCALLQRFRQQRNETLCRLLQILHRSLGIKTGEIGGQRPHRRCDRHLVVVQDDEKALLQMTRVVHRLEGHARRHGAIADHRNRIARIAAKLRRHGKAQRSGDRGR